MRKISQKLIALPWWLSRMFKRPRKRGKRKLKAEKLKEIRRKIKEEFRSTWENGKGSKLIILVLLLLIGTD